MGVAMVSDEMMLPANHHGGSRTARVAARWWASATVLAIGIPAVGLLGWTLWSDWSWRYRQAPLRALFGDEVYERLSSGAKSGKHYLGAELLAPDFELPDRHGKPWRLRQHRGRLVLLNFWSITCRPCIEEMPSLLELGGIAAEWGDVEVVTVSIDRDWKTVQALFPKQVPVTVLFDAKRQVVTRRFGTRLFPETWLIDRQGVIRWRFDGPQNWASPLLVDVIEAYR